jgi:hypothetical protein
LAKANSPYSRSIFFDCDNHKSLIYIPSAAKLFFWRTNITLVNFHPSTKKFPAGPDHRPAELVQPRPSRFVAFQAENSLQP